MSKPLQPTDFPEWNASGTKPADNLINNGYINGERPLAENFNYQFFKTYNSFYTINEFLGNNFDALETGVSGGDL